MRIEKIQDTGAGETVFERHSFVLRKEIWDEQIENIFIPGDHRILVLLHLHCFMSH